MWCNRSGFMLLCGHIRIYLVLRLYVGPNTCVNISNFRCDNFVIITSVSFREDISDLVGFVAWRASLYLYFTLAFDRLFQVRLLGVNDFPKNLDPSSGARNRRKAGVKRRRNPSFHQTDQVRYW